MFMKDIGNGTLALIATTCLMTGLVFTLEAEWQVKDRTCPKKLK